MILIPGGIFDMGGDNEQASALLFVRSLHFFT